MDFLLKGIALMAGIMIIGYVVIEYYFPVDNNNKRHWRFEQYAKFPPKGSHKD